MNGLLLLALTLWIGGAPASGAPSCAPRMPPGGEEAPVLTGDYQLEGGALSVTMPFELSGDLIVVPVTIHGVRLRVVLDTGMADDGLLLFRTPKVKKLRLKRETGGLQRSDCLQASVAVPALTADLDLPHVRLTDQPVRLQPPGDRGCGGKPNEHDGVIGLAIFGRFATSIDYERMRLTLTEPDAFRAPDRGEALPIRYTSGAFIETDAEVTLEDGRSIPLRLTVDTGNSNSLLLNMGAVEELTLPRETIEVGMTFVMGQSRGRMGRVRSLRLGSHSLPDVLATFESHDKTTFACEKDGNLGGSVLRRFTVTFDYRRHRMFLEPNRHHSQPFEHDMSGLRLEWAARGNPGIKTIVPGSPAEEAGLQAEDEVLSIGGRAARDLRPGDLSELLVGAGRRIDVTVRRAGRRQQVTLTLRRLV